MTALCASGSNTQQEQVFKVKDNADMETNAY